MTFAGIPMGHEFTSLVLALLQVGGHPSKAAQDLIEQGRSRLVRFSFSFRYEMVTKYFIYINR